MKKTKSFMKKLGFPILLLVYSLFLVNQGITVTDTGYNYGNFVNFDSLDVMWKFSTYLANVVGSLFTKLPLGETMIGLNIYTGLIKAFTSIIIYYICVYEFDMKSCLVFLSQLMALGYCWCPTALLYNYCTYLLFDLGAILICIAAKRNKFRYYLIAGICLGLNVMVRLPNLAEIALIFAVWYYSFVTKDNFIVFLKKQDYVSWVI